MPGMCGTLERAPLAEAREELGLSDVELGAVSTPHRASWGLLSLPRDARGGRGLGGLLRDKSWRRRFLCPCGKNTPFTPVCGAQECVVLLGTACVQTNLLFPENCPNGQRLCRGPCQMQMNK